MLENGGEIVGFCGAVGGFIVVDMNCGLIWIYPPPAKISRVACGMVGLDGYGFGGVVVEVVGCDNYDMMDIPEKGEEWWDICWEWLQFSNYQ